MLELVCVICQDLIIETSQVCATKCGHIFHNSCVNNWLNDSDTCPQCRATDVKDSIYKLYLESATETTDSASLEAKTAAEILQKRSLDLYEEVLLNLRRELEATENNYSECYGKLICVEDELSQLKNCLTEEIGRRTIAEERISEVENDKQELAVILQSFETENSLVQNNLKEETEKILNYKKRVIELESDKVNLKDMVQHLKVENTVVQEDLKMEIEKNGTIVAKLKDDIILLNETANGFEIENRQVRNDLEKEIERKETFEKQLAELQRDKLRLTELDHSLQSEYIRLQSDLKKQIEGREFIEKRIAELEKDKVGLTEILLRSETKNNRLVEEIQTKEKQLLELERNKEDLKEMVDRLETQNRKAQNDLEHQNKNRENIEDRIAQLEKKVVTQINTGNDVSLSPSVPISLRPINLDIKSQIDLDAKQNDLRNETVEKFDPEPEKKLQTDTTTEKTIEGNKCEREIVHPLKVENKDSQKDSNRTNAILEEQFAEVLKILKQEQEAREKSEKRLADLERDRFRPETKLHNLNQQEEVDDVQQATDSISKCHPTSVEKELKANE